SHVVTTVASHPQKTHTPRQAKRGRDTGIPQSSGPPKKVGDESVYTAEDDRVVWAATTTISLEAERESDAKIPHWGMQMLRLGGHTPGSDEGRPNINELMAICIKLSNRVLALETSKTVQDLVIKKLKKKVKRLEKKLRARTPRMKFFKIEGNFDDDFDDIDDMVNEAIENVDGDIVNVGGTVNTATIGVSATGASVTTDGVSISTAELRTPPTTTTTAFEDKDLTIAQTLVKMRSQKDNEKGKGKRSCFQSCTRRIC
ncbi:hypothetical protein Tco_1477903, partial [Tanacetum coccineum]